MHLMKQSQKKGTQIKYGKSVVSERFIRTLKNKIFKHMTAISKNVYFDVLNDIVNKYNKYNK